MLRAWTYVHFILCMCELISCQDIHIYIYIYTFIIVISNTPYFNRKKLVSKSVSRTGSRMRLL